MAPTLWAARFDGWPPERAGVSQSAFVRTGEGGLTLAAMRELARRRVHAWESAPTQSLFPTLTVERIDRGRNARRAHARPAIVD
ncbi:hypothetical protein [Pandoraea sputorum]|uniref:hypothetical protein n=1 Tax=Pandoraea sputorum TaxID=93222 RepID=UPI0037CA6806